MIIVNHIVTITPVENYQLPPEATNFVSIFVNNGVYDLILQFSEETDLFMSLKVSTKLSNKHA